MIWNSVQFGNANLYSKWTYYLMKYYTHVHFNWFLNLKEDENASVQSKGTFYCVISRLQKTSSRYQLQLFDSQRWKISQKSFIQWQQRKIF